MIINPSAVGWFGEAGRQNWSFNILGVDPSFSTIFPVLQYEPIIDFLKVLLTMRLTIQKNSAIYYHDRALYCFSTTLLEFKVPHNKTIIESLVNISQLCWPTALKSK